MKRFVILLWAVMACMMIADAASVVINGVRYKARGSSDAVCSIENAKDRSVDEIEVLERVTIDGMPREVTSVAANGFKGAKYLKSVVLPNSVTRIGANAFEGCAELEKIVMPDQARIDIPRESYGYGGNGPFTGCRKLREVRGNKLEYPEYVLTYAFLKCDEVPFAAEIPFLTASDPDKVLLAAAQQSLDVKTPVEAAVKTPQDVSEPISEVDRNIPRGGVENKNRFAVIIGNQHYRDGVAEVAFANKDARIFADYCNRTLGIPESNIRSYTDATYGDMLGALKDLATIADVYKGDIDVVFYYAGHGIPDEHDRSAYLMPVDADGTMTEVCMPVTMLYDRLGSLGARSVVVFLDACFSGSLRGDGVLMAARGVKIKTSTTRPKGKTVVFSAASGDQTAFPYTEKGHGIFTYYLLDKLQQSRGDVTLGELADYLTNNVAQQSVVINRKVQIPVVNASAELSDSGQNLKLK